MNDTNSLSHTKWNCKYHIVFAPKYRRKVFYKEKRREVGKILRTLCEWKKIKIVEAEVCPDHVHMLVEIPPKVAISSFMGYLKGKSSLMIYEKYPELKYKYRNREFWCRGYYVDTAGKNAKKIQEYIQNQLNELLEKLNPNLSNFWAIVVFLIENGAYFTKQVGWGDDVVSWSSAKDIARTNYIYRIAKDNISK